MLESYAKTPMPQRQVAFTAVQQTPDGAVDLCPCCGHIVALKRPLVDVRSRTITWNGQVVKVRPHAVLIMALLTRKAPAVVSFDSLVHQLYGFGIDVPANPRRVVYVDLVALRRQIAPLGLRIINHYGLGMSLAIEEMKL